MKKTIRLLMPVFILILSTGLMAQPKQKIGSHKLKLAWSKFARNKSIRVLNFRKLGRSRYQVDMRGIKTALERAGISEPVFISIKMKRSQQLNLGKFSPSMAGNGGNDNGGGNPKPNNVKFLMPPVKQVMGFALSGGNDNTGGGNGNGPGKGVAMSGGDSPSEPTNPNGPRSRVTSAQLIFRNVRGQVKARITVNLRGL